MRSTSVEFKFAHVDSSNIFNFISEVRVGAVQTFEKFEDIENYLRNQWSGMFYSYLDELRSKKNREEVLDSVTHIKLATERMNDILKAVGQKLFDKDEDRPEFEKILRDQNEKLVRFFASKVRSNIVFEQAIWTEKEQEISEIFVRYYLQSSLLFEIYNNQKKVDWKIMKEKIDMVVTSINNELKHLGVIEQVVVDFVNYDNIIPVYYQEIKPLIENDATLKDVLIDELKKEFELYFMPF